MDNTNKMVKDAYKGFFDDGAIFIDQIESPIEFPCIEGWMPPAFISCVRTMEIGETQCVRVSADEAYEQRTEERVLSVARAQIPDSVKLIVGEMVNLESPSGQTYPARLIELNEDEAIFDTNHEAIAKALNFEITLLEVQELPGRP